MHDSLEGGFIKIHEKLILFFFTQTHVFGRIQYNELLKKGRENFGERKYVLIYYVCGH